MGVAESNEKYGNVNRALSLRQLIETEDLMSRAPTAGEREAMEVGLDALGVPWTGQRQRTRPPDEANG